MRICGTNARRGTDYARSHANLRPSKWPGFALHPGTLGEFREATGEEIARMYEWFDEGGYVGDILTLREEYPDLTTFEQYLRQSG